MNKLKHWFSRRGALPLTCYLAAALLWVASALVFALQDAAAVASGKLEQRTLSVTDWQPVALELLDEQPDSVTLRTQDMDPQLLLDGVQGTVRTISYTVSMDDQAREVCVYYTTKPGEDYSPDRRVYAQYLGEGRYLFELPRTRLDALRIDPCSPVEGHAVTLTFTPGSIVFNAQDTLPSGLGYLVPDWYQLFCLVLYPGLAAAAISWLCAVVKRFKA